jgi:hypothetical protein
VEDALAVDPLDGVDELGGVVAGAGEGEGAELLDELAEVAVGGEGEDEVWGMCQLTAGAARSAEADAQRDVESWKAE